MSSTVTVTIKEATRKGEKGFTGTVAVPGLKPTQVARAKDGATLFPTTSSLKSATRSFAKRFGVDVEYVEPAKKAAKKSVKSK